MWAAAGVVVATGAARQDGLAAHPSGVHRAERRRGEGGKHARVRGDRLRDALTPGQAGPDELPGIALVHRRAGRADGLAAVPARDTNFAVEGGEFAGAQVDHVGADVAAWLGTEPGQEAVIRKRLQLLDGVPAVISTSYYPLWVAEGTRLESSDALPEGPDNLIERLGNRFARGMELLQARMPTPDEVRVLKLDPGVPVVRMLHIDYAPDGRTLQVADDLYAADRHEFAFEWTEPDGAPIDD